MKSIVPALVVVFPAGKFVKASFAGRAALSSAASVCQQLLPSQYWPR